MTTRSRTRSVGLGTAEKAALSAPTVKLKVDSRSSEEDSASAPASLSKESLPPQMVYPRITFKFEDAVKHLCGTDDRWASIFERIPCRPYQEGLEQPINIFRTLCSSILGQQISYKAAGAITRRFVLIWFEEDEVPPPTLMGTSKVWPSPEQVAAVDVSKLREAGLSGRKAEYIVLLAQQFAEGTLDPKVLVQMDDDEVMKTLCRVRGIGPWTCHMLLMFAFKRPDILPVGDIGVQKGVLSWFAHVKPDREVRGPAPEQSDEESRKAGFAIADLEEEESKVSLTRVNTRTPPATPSAGAHKQPATLGTPEKSKRRRVKTEERTDPLLATPVTPVSRAGGKRKLPKGTHMHADDMERLCQIWAPYRSIASWYLWALAGEADYEY